MNGKQQVDRFLALVRQYGLRRCAERAWYDVRRRRGWLSGRFPRWQWAERPLADWLRPRIPGEPEAYRQARERLAPPFFFAAGRIGALPAAWQSDAVERADGLLDGQFTYFQRRQGHLSFPAPAWFLNPFTGRHTDAASHWLARSDFEPSLGDIKFIWEPSRCLWVYDLVRAHAATGDPRYAEGFWQLVESWRLANPPQMGPNWQCGQEIALRVLALTFGLHAFWPDDSSTPRRIADLVVLLAASAERIAANIAYGRAQMGNHATSEAAALVTVGRLFPELAQARRWLAVGKHVLADESRLFHWPDGSYVQHSLNYHRLMLDAYLWAGALGALHDDPLPDRVLARLDAAWEFLYQLQDPSTGRVPNYGPNDGAQALPLHGCGYLDYRPTIDACCILTRSHACYDDGPWAEKARWLFNRRQGAWPAAVPLPRQGRWFVNGGYDTFRGRESWGMVRCHSYRNRPNQADMLHFDLWWRGLNILRDSGTCTYYDPEHGWDQYFKSTAAHNTVRIGGTDQMIMGARFQWHSLVASRRIQRAAAGDLEVWTGEHRGYLRLPARAIHQRTICRCGDAGWIVIDDIRGCGHSDVELFWQLHAAPVTSQGFGWRLETERGPVACHLACSAPCALLAMRGEDGAMRAGWESLYYGERTPAPTLRAAASAPLPVRFITLIAFASSLAVTADDQLRELRWRSDGSEGILELGPPGKASGPIVSLVCDDQRWPAPHPAARSYSHG